MVYLTCGVVKEVKEAIAYMTLAEKNKFIKELEAIKPIGKPYEYNGDASDY